MIKIIIAGGREFSDFNLLINVMNEIIKKLDDKEIVIISGKSKGADLLGEKYAKLNNYIIDEYPINWKKYGRKAGCINNNEMIIKADILVAFWDTKSKGTKHIINMANKYNKQCFIINY